MKNVLVLGGSGFVGRHLIYEMLKKCPDVQQVTSVSRSEGNVSQLLMECPDKRLKIMLADVRDGEAMKYALRDKDTVIHLAAMKRVDLGEMLSRDAVTTNVIGTLNILDNFRGSTFILMSTDKAVEPVNCYGATKLICERMVTERARMAVPGVRYMMIRSGNIMGSTGSVLDIWKYQIKENNEITVTHPDMMRFYTDVAGVVRVYLAVLAYGENGKIYFTPRGEPIPVKDLVQQAIKLYGNDKTAVRFIGLRPGERMEEKMRSELELNCVDNFEQIVQSMNKVPAEQQKIA